MKLHEENHLEEKMTDSITRTILFKMTIAEGCNRSILCMGKGTK